MADTNNFKVWMIRAGEGSYLLDEFLGHNIIAIGWNEIGEIDNKITYGELKERFIKAYPEDTKGRVNTCVGQLWRFAREFKIGDRVITYDSSSRVYYLGKITGSYEFNPAYTHHHVRAVLWDVDPVDRDILKPETKNYLGAILTIFEVPASIWTELEGLDLIHVSQKELDELEEIAYDSEQQELEQFKERVISQSQEFIKDGISKLSWQETEQLAAGLLRSMGYKIRMTSKSSDLGSDIFCIPRCIRIGRA